MPYILSPKLTLNMESHWLEGSPLEKENIYSIQPDRIPPVNYDKILLKPHSITHAESERHVLNDGKVIENYFENPKYFYGPCIVVRLKGNKYRKIDSIKNIYHWEVTKQELVENIYRVQEEHKINRFNKIILTSEFYPINKDGFHDSNYILTLSQSAADYLINVPDFNLYGTSWKSSDYQPGSLERPIHKTLFSKSIIFELLDLNTVPEGEYFFSGFPLRLPDSSESPVTPVLFSKDEIIF